jgi:Resolvase, N terminal domain
VVAKLHRYNSLAGMTGMARFPIEGGLRTFYTCLTTSEVVVRPARFETCDLLLRSSTVNGYTFDFLELFRWSTPITRACPAHIEHNSEHEFCEVDMKAALYTRVSTKDKEKGDDGEKKPRQYTANQIDQLRSFCQSQEWEIVAEYEDHETGSRADRTQSNP